MSVVESESPNVRSSSDPPLAGAAPSPDAAASSTADPASSGLPSASAEPASSELARASSPPGPSNETSEQALLDTLCDILAPPGGPTPDAAPRESELAIPIEVTQPIAEKPALASEAPNPPPISAAPVIAVARTISIGPSPEATQQSISGLASAPSFEAPPFDPASHLAPAAPSDLPPLAASEPIPAAFAAAAPLAAAPLAAADPGLTLPFAAAPAQPSFPIAEVPSVSSEVFAQPPSPALEANPFTGPTSVPVFSDSGAAPIASEPSGPEALDAAARRLEESFERYQRRFGESERPAAAELPVFAAPVATHQSPIAEPTAASTPEIPVQVQPAQSAAAEQPPNLDLEKDVDWGEHPESAAKLLGRVAAAIPLAEVHPVASASLKESARAPGAARGQTAFAENPGFAESRPRVRGRVDSWVDEQRELADETGPHSAARGSGRRRGGRSRSDTSAVLIFSFVGGVILALGTGFVAGFVVGRGSPTASEPRPERTQEQKPERADSVADDSLPSDELEIVKNPDRPAARAVPSAGAVAAGAPFAGNKPNRAAFDQKSTFDQKSAGAALSKAQARAGLCVQPGDPGGTAVVTVTFDPSGTTSNAGVYGARFSGTPAGECILKTLRELKVRPFTGDPVTVKKTISVE